MPAFPLPATARPRRVSAGTFLTAILLIMVTTSCTGLGQASAAGSTRQDLAAEMATQLAVASALTYTATYRLPGGATARAARRADPLRTAYVYPSGRLITTSSTVTECTRPAGEMVCSTTDRGSSGDQPPPSAQPPVGQPPSTQPLSAQPPSTQVTVKPASARSLPPTSGMVEPEAVLTMLENASIAPAVEIEQQDTTLAGRPATCLRVRGPDSFRTCVTVEGMLASFTGHIDGAAVEMVLIEYTDETDDLDFTIPPNAHFVDRRSN